MTPVLDASAVVALLEGEPGGPAVAQVIRDGAWVSSVNFAEARDRILRGGPDRPRRSAAVAELVRRGLRIVACDEAIATVASDLRSDHYQRSSMAVSLGDCVALATAREVGGTLVTSDAKLVELAVRIGVAVHPIANSAGDRPVA